MINAKLRMKRRAVLWLGIAAVAALALPASAAETAPRREGTGICVPRPHPRSASGIEGQRKGDLGNGYYVNPVLAGDHPDPSDRPPLSGPA